MQITEDIGYCSFSFSTGVPVGSSISRSNIRALRHEIKQQSPVASCDHLNHARTLRALSLQSRRSV